VIIPVGPGHQDIVSRAKDSVARAVDHGLGAFDEVQVLEMDDTQGLLGRSHVRNLAVQEAGNRGIEWLFFLDADDVICPTAFADVAELLPEQDAVWGAIYIADLQSGQVSRRDPQISPIDNLEQVLLNDPFLTLQMGHFVRQAVAAATPFDTAMDTGEDFDYYLRVWKEQRCVKIDKPLFFNVRGQHSSGPRSATGQDWRRAINQVFSRFCRDNEVIANVPFSGQQVYFRLGNTLDLIQNQLARERFFEVQELSETLLSLPPQPRVLDVGSNIGNHALFLTCIGDAAQIDCFEPAAHIADQLEENFRLNDVAPQRYRIHRLGIGASHSRASLDRIDESNLGATSLKSDDGGQIEVETLDRLFPEGPVDLIKIDVEGMEMEVLAGAQQLIQRTRPALLIEIANTNKGAFMAWLGRQDYRVHRVFELVYASNYLVLPMEERRSVAERGTAAHSNWKPRVALAPQQPACGWSMDDFLKMYLGEKPALELRLHDGRLLARDLLAEREIPLGDNALNELNQNFALSALVLGDILGALNDQQLDMILKGLKRHAGGILLLDLMDARWNDTFQLNKRFRDAEWYLRTAGQHGLSLHAYQKLPHKAALGVHEQLDSRLTLLHLAPA
jgi:FkbM family methyltransferase